MLYSEAEPLVSFDRVCMGEGLYVELFLIGALNRLRGDKEEEPI